jgi:hypothetical protein
MAARSSGYPRLMVDEALRRPGLDDATVEAVGKLREAFEWVERARGALYDFHHLTGHADLLFGDAADLLERAGHGEEATRLRREVLGRNVLCDRWTFQLVEDFDDGYHADVCAAERAIREGLVGGVRHEFEARFKEQRRTAGRPGHAAGPPSGPPGSAATSESSGER